MNVALKLIPTLLIIFGCLAPVAAQDSSVEYLERLERVLGPKDLREFISKRRVKAVIQLAMDEDLDADYPNFFLLSDDMLTLLHKGGVLKSKFADEIEAFQAYVDSLKNDEDKALAISSWKSLWLDKVSEYQVYLKGLKRNFSYDVTQAFNYDSNIALRDNDDQTSGKSDPGASIAGGFNYKPFINLKKSVDWNYTFRTSGVSTFQQDEEELEYHYLTWSHKLVYPNLTRQITSLSFDLSGTYGYNHGPESRYEYNQYAFGSRVSFLPFNSEHITFGLFKSGVHTANLRYRKKDEKAVTIAPTSVISTPQTDVDIYNISYGQLYSLVDKSQPFQILSWNLSYESQNVDIDDSRDYSFFKLSAFYLRDISSIIDGSDLSWNTSVSFRLKDWDSPQAAGDEDDEEEYYISTGVSNSWNSKFSTSLNLSFRKRNQGNLNASGTDIDQWRIVLSNSFISL